MDFAKVFDVVAGFFEKGGFPFAVAGALGLHAYGHMRASYDLDIVADAAAQAPLVAFLETIGYETLHVSAGYSNHLHGQEEWGRLDLIYVQGETSRLLFAACRPRLTLGARSALVPRPEHLAAMKAQAIKNDPTRALQDMADVQFLLRLPGVDAEEVRGYFEKAGLLDKYDEIRRSL